MNMDTILIVNDSVNRELDTSNPKAINELQGLTRISSAEDLPLPAESPFSLYHGTTLSFVLFGVHYDNGQLRGHMTVKDGKVTEDRAIYLGLHPGVSAGYPYEIHGREVVQPAIERFFENIEFPIPADSGLHDPIVLEFLKKDIDYHNGSCYSLQ